MKITGDVSEVTLSQRSCLVSITYSRESCHVVSEESLFTEGARRGEARVKYNNSDLKNAGSFFTT